MSDLSAISCKLFYIALGAFPVLAYEFHKEFSITALLLCTVCAEIIWIWLLKYKFRLI